MFWSSRTSNSKENILIRPNVTFILDFMSFLIIYNTVYIRFLKKNSRIHNKQMFTNARAFSRVSYFLYFFCFSHMFCGKKVVVVFL